MDVCRSCGKVLPLSIEMIEDFGDGSARVRAGGVEMLARQWSDEERTLVSLTPDVGSR